MESRSDSSSQLNQEYKRYRFNTISVMSSIKKPQSECEPSKNRSFRITEPKKSGLNPRYHKIISFSFELFNKQIELIVVKIYYF